MPRVRGRAKKLIVAFHFHRSRQAGWKCDGCRKSGLDRKRRCGYLPAEQRGPVVTVWTGGGLGLKECPKPVMTPLSLMYLESFFAHKLNGAGAERWDWMPAKQMDAWQVLAEELRKEEAND